MLVSDFHFDLPEAQIAQEPLADRAGSRLLHVTREPGPVHDLQFRDFPELLRAGDLLVRNNTRVFPARLYGRRGGTQAQAVGAHNSTAREFPQGRIEVLLTRQTSEERNEWECLVRPGRKIGVGERLFFGERGELQAEVISRGTFGERVVRFAPAADFFGVLEGLGHMPLPPYISRADRPADRERYQTVYATERGSVAAPTAGLHFTPEILNRIRGRGVEVAEVTLHVGLGTFQPVHVERVEDHRLHREAYSISEEAAAQINRARAEGRRIVAVGTTTVRTLEYAVAQSADGKIAAGAGAADLFIFPGYSFRVVKAMLTNFHLPQSTLLMLVCALGGQERILAAYRHAVQEGYRFYSYGDCMFVERGAAGRR